MIMITPVEWRDYKSKKEVLSSFNSNEDFMVCSPIGEYSKWDNMSCNKSELIKYFVLVDKVKVRYKKLTEIAIIDLKEEDE